MPRHVVVDPGNAALAGDVWEGAGPVVVFLHPAVTDRRGWEATIEALRRRVQAVTYDRRGYGQTPPSAQPWSELHDLWAVLDHLGPDAPVWLAAGSAGGAIALEAAFRAPERVAGLVLIAPAVPGAPVAVLDPAAAALRAAIDDADKRHEIDETNRLELRLWLDGPGQPEGRVGGPTRELVAEMNATALRNETLGAQAVPPGPLWGRTDLPQPVLVLSGDLDLPHIRARGEQLAASLPNGRHELIRGVAHLPYVEQPGVVAQWIIEAIGGAGALCHTDRPW